MWKAVRSVAAVIAGFVAASAVMMMIESVNGHVLYPEVGKLAEGMTDKEAIRALLASAPVGALLVVLLGWVLGSLLGGFLAAWIGWNAPVAHALVLGGLLTLAGIANNLMLPPPAWFWIPSLVVLLPAAFAGARLAPRRSHAKT
jgi:MFS family permease